MATTQSSVNEQTRSLINAVVQDLVAQQSGPASRDFGSDVGGAPTAGTPPPNQDAQRLFGGILSGLVANVVPKIATGILGMLQQRRRELGIPEQRDAAATERDLQSILNSLLPKLIEAVPVIAGALAGKPAPRGAEEEGQRFLPILGALLPAVISAVPGIIGAFNRQRGADPTQPPISNPEVAERFIGPLLGTLVPPLLQAAPSILQSIFGGGRGNGGAPQSRGTSVW
jgi:hypothetical protein